MVKAFAVCSALLALFFLASCESVYETMKADPIPPTSFLPYPNLLKAQRASFPFNRLWYQSNIDWRRFTKLKFDQVDVSHMLADSWWQKVSAVNVTNMKKDVPELANYMRSAFISKISERTHNKLSVSDSVDEHTAIVQLALVQLVPTQAFLNAAGTVAGFFIPGASLISMADSGSIAMECKVIDGKTGQVIVMLTDCRKDSSAIIDVNGLTWYGHAKETMVDWADSFAELCVVNDRSKLKREFPISIISI